MIAGRARPAPLPAALAVRSQFVSQFEEGRTVFASPQPTATVSIPPSTAAGGAARLPRLAAITVDTLLVLATVLLVRFAMRLGVVPGWGAWHPGVETDGWIDAQVIVVTWIATALRDVPAGASLAKWILCLRVVDRSGKRLGFWRRLARAPFSLLPFAWMSRRIQANLPWHVATYTPSARGLALRTALAGAAAAASVAWGVDTVRPSIGRRDAERLVHATVLSDPHLQRLLGAPLAWDVQRISPRAHERVHGARGRFELVVRGSEMQQNMVVVALKIDGRWVVDEITDIAMRDVDPPAAVARR